MSKPSGKMTQSSSPVIPEQYKRRMDQLVNTTWDTLGNSFVGNDPLVAGSNQNIDQAQQMAMQTAQGGMQDIANQQRGIFGNLQAAGDWQNNPALQAQMQQIAQNAQQNFQENVMPSLRTNAVQAGQAGSSRQGIAEGIAARDMSRNVSQQQTGLLANAYNQAIGANQAALQGAGTAMQNMLAPSSVFGSVGAQQRDIEQQLLDQKLMRQNAELARLQGLSNIQGATIAPSIGSIGTSKQGSRSWQTGDWAQAALGGGMAAFGV